MEIRPLRGRPDVRGALRVNRAAWRAAYADIVSDEVLARLAEAPTADDVDRWYVQLADVGADGRVLVADRGSSDAPDVVGYAYVRWGDGTKAFVGEGEAGLKELYVAPDYWREGVGSALLERGVAAVPEGTAPLKLETLSENRRGRAFYEAKGFERVGSSSFELLGHAYPTVVYARRTE